jgi:hypothetical protein
MTVTREYPPDFNSSRLAAWGATVFGGVVAWYLTGTSWAGAGAAALGLYCALSLELRAWRISRDQKELDLRDKSFVLRRGAESREYRDADVAAVAYARFTTFNNGLVSGAYRRFHVWMVGGAKPIEFEHFFVSADPLHDFVERLIGQAVTKAEESLKAGGELDGVGWRLQAATFFPRRGMPLPLADITGIGVYDGSVCLWLKQKAEPAIKIPLGSLNAVVLLRLLWSRLADRPLDEGLIDEDALGLGRVLFERRQGYLIPRVLLAIGGLLFVGGFFTPDPFACGRIAYL